MTDTPNFIIPVGTQVVLRQARRVPGTDLEKPAGSVAEVIESPPNNLRAYAIRFFDGVTMRAKFAELAVRRRDCDNELEELATPGVELSESVVYRVVVGSRAFGLSTDSSDEDRRSVFVPPAEMHWSLFKPPEQIDTKGDGVEEVSWELEKFSRLALQANPNILETLWSPLVLHADETGQELRALRGAFLSRHVYKTYSGYVLSQFRLMRRKYEAEGAYKSKHAMHLVRLLHSGIHALRDGDIRVDVAEHRGELLAVRNGTLSFGEVRERAEELDRDFQAAFASTRLPEQPDYARVNRFLIEARRRAAR